MKRLMAVAAVSLAVACTLERTDAGPPATAPTAAPTAPAASPPAVRPPAELLPPAPQGYRVASRRDHLDAVEAARDERDQAAAIDRFLAWGWADAADESLAGPAGGSVSVLVVRTLRRQGALAAAEAWLGGAPGSPCAVAPAVRCRRAENLAVGSAGTYAFRIAGAEAAVAALTGPVAEAASSSSS